ncbi:Peroxidase 10 [Mucuna pruriens]|uniref:peroxidase n=1 Tax=Mucuna pruriens TaxID=157652 RepID=A0A371HTP2_MUCPR|nr:Peroxidase 10 [Mucuna pruriens]
MEMSLIMLNCLLKGCDGSVLLDDTPYFTGEKNAFPNRNSLRGFGVIDNIKEQVEMLCPSIVSCADILALAVREAIDLVGGPSWSVALGRRDATTTSQAEANQQIPSPFEPLDNIIAKFASKGLNLRDVVALSGAHTIGYAQCFIVKRRLFDFQGSGKPDPVLDFSLLSKLQNMCPDKDTSNRNLAPLDANSTLMFDNEYYRNLVYNKGLLESDQALMKDRRTAAMAYYYSIDQNSFYNDFATSMVKLSNVGVLTGIKGQIRKKCGSLDINFYDGSCPNLPMMVRFGVWSALRNDNRMAASLLRLHFHDCIVNGCDGSVLLDDTPYFTGEKNALSNRNSLRGFEVIDNIKEQVERLCPSTVSCADILALTAREAILQVGGPFWPVALGRRDAITTSQTAANQQIPSPIEPLENITAKFTSKGLDLRDVVALSGAHTIGFAQCFTFKGRLFDFEGSGKPDPVLDFSLLSKLQTMCPNSDASNSNLAPLDATSTLTFDNEYYRNLVYNTGLLQSDQALFGDPTTAPMVYYYSNNQYSFYNDFAASMVKLSNVGVLTGIHGEIRKKCGFVN